MPLIYFPRKRYEKAEAEYVTAKVDLHKKTDVKEQLTEHLCTIIQQNELRKAHKLEELMQQLQLQATKEELEGQREEEEEEGRRRSSVETQSKGEWGTGLVGNHEGQLKLAKEYIVREEETVWEEKGGDIHREQDPETMNTQQHCQRSENCVQNEISASWCSEKGSICSVSAVVQYFWTSTHMKGIKHY